MAESAVMYSVGSQLIRTGQTETTSHIYLYQMSVRRSPHQSQGCLLYTSDAADALPCADLGGRRIHKKKKKNNVSS